MMTGKKRKIIPMLMSDAKREQMINAINANTLSVNMMIDILDKLVFIVDELRKKVQAAEEKEG